MVAFISSLLCLTAFAGTGHFQQSAPQPVARVISLSDYLATLDGLHQLVKALDERRPASAGDILIQVPAVWRVQVDGQRFEVSAEWIRSALIEWRTRPARGIRDELAARLEAVRVESARYVEATPDASADRRRLRTILEAREFKDLQGPSWLDRLRQKALYWLVALLTRTLGAASIPTITNFVVYLAIAVLVVLISMYAWRSLHRSAQLDSIRPDRIPQVARPWTAWLEEARAAAGRHDWAEAVHMAYWCGVAFLEDTGAWRPDRSRTPREYLRVLGTSHEHRPALHALTRELEHVWYAAGDADASRYDAMLGELEKLGCPSR